MEYWGILIALLLAFIVFAPILGLVAFFQIGKLRRDLSQIRQEMMALRRSVMQGDDLQVAPTALKEESVSVTVPATPMTPGAKAEPDRPAFERPTPRKAIEWERMIAANWTVWAGGLALAIGGLFLVRVAVDAGLFGPLARTLSAVLLGVALIFAAFRSERWSLVTASSTSVRFLPPILAGAGVISFYGAAIAAGHLYALVPPLAALVLLVVVSAIAVALSLKYGPLLAGLGLSGAYLAPFLTGAPDGSALPLLIYAAMITIAGLALVRLKGWRFLTLLLLMGAGLWGLIGIASAEPGFELAVTVYALVIALTGLVYGAQAAQSAFPLPENWTGLIRLLRQFPASLAAAHMFWLLSGGLIILQGLLHGAPTPVVSGLAIFGGMGLVASWQRKGYRIMTLLAAGVTLIALLFWNRIAPGLAYACFAAAIGYGIAGTLVMSMQKVKAPVAMAAALVPPAAIFIAFWRHNALEPGFIWGLVALFSACCMGAVLDGLRRTDTHLDRYTGAAAAYALGAVLSAVLAPFLMFSGLWLGPAMAVVALAISLVYQRFPLPVLKLVIPASVALATGLMVRPGMLSGLQISPVPILNEMTLGFGVAIAALYLGAFVMGRDDRNRRAYEGGALILLFSFIGLTIRHIAGQGSLNGPYAGLGEASGYAIAYTGMAASLAMRFRTVGWFWQTVEYVALALGGVGIMMAFAALPGAQLGSLPILNVLLPAFAMPALLLAVYAAGLRRRGAHAGANVASAAAILLGFAWVTFETTFALTGSALGAPADGFWAYSATWVAYAFALLFWGVLRQRLTARYASLAILVLSIAKVFLFDMAALEGIARAGSFIGLGAALIGVALFYQRYVFSPQRVAAHEDGSHS